MIIIAFLAFYVAFNLGANDVANAMGTSVGSKAITLKQAIIIAGILEFTGAVLFGHGVTETLGTKIANPELFTTTPQTLLLGMVTVLIAAGIWLQIATSRGLPVSSSHAVVGAIAGFTWVALGIEAIDWSSIGLITIGWILTPVISGIVAAFFYSLIQRWILAQPHPVAQLQEWIPWLSTILITIFGVIVLPTLTQPLTNYLIKKVGLNIPTHDIPIFTGAAAAIGLTLYSWKKLQDNQKSFSQSPIPNPVESLFARFQLLSACFVAFAHGSNDVGNAIAPLAVISYINQTGSVPINGLTIPIWIMILGGLGIVAGLAIWGQKVIATIGENIISLQPSSGFCAELATAATILLASRFGLPVSTSHALVGGVVGIGLVQNLKSIKFQTLQGIASAWVITVPISAIISATIFSIIRMILN
ncbi:inorganic phosphate transporter [Anabaena cylindrica FACHB-243]|uniref:Phosphate transporter n=1 Tax=Anabaena cylindrica (strain ATCC 27899 / PCC 7122) TaxID=272123 RepID=K9Z9L0_ANACC|nr:MULTISPECIES: inorganic phosphate transporter [Anabaena]AFZ55856.1 phosphate transporter [Anabaena cylindrica PCC 7122]MBD2421277.1 inorganic phosphate transporter [Anabaena cylindrica FACHB-243]MCM2406609.1 inorganic phosphate transporter [Anabaena sp. CCAP 1446/1C]BAY01721.1 phosphate transporter [Anabaena cylindrica PCC 7122]